VRRLQPRQHPLDPRQLPLRRGLRQRGRVRGVIELPLHRIQPRRELPLQPADLVWPAREVSCWPEICKLAHAFLWEHSYKGLKLAQILGQLGGFLTCERRCRHRRLVRPRHAAAAQRQHLPGLEPALLPAAAAAAAAATTGSSSRPRLRLAAARGLRAAAGLLDHRRLALVL
jgi:hypothetical protein